MRPKKVEYSWRDLISGFWLIPCLVFIVSCALAVFSLFIDHTITIRPIFFGLLSSPSAVRAVLSTIAGSLITVSGLVFSLTMVALQLVASQFGPRILRGFVGNRPLQFIAGTFIGISAYSLIVLVDIRDPTEAGGEYIPEISVAIAVILAFIGLVLLLFFIGLTLRSLQISNVTATIAEQTLKSINEPYPTQHPKAQVAKNYRHLLREWESETQPLQIQAQRVGYVQTINIDRLFQIIEHARLRAYLKIYPGRFVTHSTTIGELWSTQQVDEELLDKLRDCIVISTERDLEQDAAFGMRQLADIALRALSPAINDPTTTILCLNYLQTLLEYMIHHFPPTHLLFSGKGMLIARFRQFHEYSEILIEIGRYGAQNIRVVLTLLYLLQSLSEEATAAEKTEELPTLASIANAIATFALSAAQTDLERALIQEQLAQTLKSAQPLSTNA